MKGLWILLGVAAAGFGVWWLYRHRGAIGVPYGDPLPPVPQSATTLTAEELCIRSGNNPDACRLALGTVKAAADKLFSKPNPIRNLVTDVWHVPASSRVEVTGARIGPIKLW